MKKIVYNEDNLNEKDINRIVKRAKAIIINSQDEILLAYINSNYNLLGGHVDNGETDLECIKRELMEEAGIEFNGFIDDPILSIIYMTKNYPENNINTKFINNYYIIKTDLEPNLDKVTLTDQEIEGNFKVKKIKKNLILQELIESLNTCTKENVVKDTIEVVRTYLAQ